MRGCDERRRRDPSTGRGLPRGLTAAPAVALPTRGDNVAGGNARRGFGGDATLTGTALSAGGGGGIASIGGGKSSGGGGVGGGGGS